MTVILSVTASAAKVTLRAGSLAYHDGNIDFSYAFDSAAGKRYSVQFYRERVIVFDTSSADYLKIEDHAYAYVDHFFNRATGEYVYFGSEDDEYITIYLTDDTAIYDLVPIRDANVLAYVHNFSEMIFGVVTDFSKIISENALMLLFVIGLPVCSLGVGFLIRLKERT
ncbi:MAG: hypothetical protein J6K63_02935 [Clostridia bacterium]|nr:hypothetical protein [Clostridia bacterium]